MASAPEVEVELFINGRGPEHVFRARLGGWEHNRLDLEQIMIDHKLRALYAYSVSSGRGRRLLYNPRTGLSIIPYSGKADAIIRLDGVPKGSLMVPIVKIVAGIGLIAGMVACIFIGLPEHWIERLQDASGGRIMWLLCFVTMIVLQISKRRRRPVHAD